jgi:hypothetical protein
MRLRLSIALAILAACGFSQACTTLDAVPEIKEDPKRNLKFDIKVTRDGKDLTASSTKTKGEIVDAGDMLATMDTRRPFGLVGVEKGTNTILIDNSAVYSSGTGYQKVLESGLLEIPGKVLFSAYYPHVRNVDYQEDNTVYTIPFTVNETEAGPLVSKTVERAIDQLNILPLEFGHITDDIGFRICDVTPMPELQGLIHLKKFTSYNVASAGVYVNDLTLNNGFWNFQSYYRNVVVFEGDVVVGVGSENKKFVGRDALVDTMEESNRYYAIPDEILMGKQYVEAVFDVDGFYIEDYYYEPLKDQVAKYMLYGLLPNNEFVPGKQYTFHVGLDLSSIYKEVSFTAGVSEWETKIYEDNEDF